MSKWYKWSFLVAPIGLSLICVWLTVQFGKYGSPLEGAGILAVGLSMSCFLTAALLGGMISIIAVLVDILETLQKTKDGTLQNKS